ncbi:MAG: stalk domain-containing protein [Clostridia bacterium]|nr:stalk domain-containing protein [Clostridia bacterium]
MKKLAVFLLTLIMLVAGIAPVAFADDAITVTLDGRKIEFDVEPIAIDGRALVPVRAIFEALEMNVEWDKDTDNVVAHKNGIQINFTIGSNTVYRNGVGQTVDVPPQAINNRTLVPVRFISEYSGADVVWDQPTKTVIIKSADKIKYIDWNDYYGYWGEVDETGENAEGYGILYSVHTGEIAQMGLYHDSIISQGIDYVDDGSIFEGYYDEKGGYLYGRYTFSDGDYYEGGIQDMQFHSKGTYYNAEANTISVGNYQNGKRHGVFEFENLTTGEKWTSTYMNGERISSTYEE